MAVATLLVALSDLGGPSSGLGRCPRHGFGIYLSIDQALVTQVLPSAAERARSLGVISVASSAGQAVAPAIAAPVVTYLGGFTTLYLWSRRSRCSARPAYCGSAQCLDAPRVARAALPGVSLARPTPDTGDSVQRVPVQLTSRALLSSRNWVLPPLTSVAVNLMVTVWPM